MATPSSNSTATIPFEQIAWQISVDGQAIRRVLSFRLEQSFGAHHSFELRLYHTEIEDPRAYRIDKSKELLGKAITVILGTQLNADLNRFGGVITEVGFEEANGMYGIVVLKGYSPTILLESGPNMRSFYNRNLSGIAGDIAGTVKGKLDVAVKPRFGGNIEYSVQHKESHFQFLNRLSASYGEWFYYDGEKLNFGRPANQPTFDLQYVRHLQNLKMNLQVVPMSFTHLAHRDADDQVLRKDSPQRVDGLDYYGDLAVQKSAQIFGGDVKNTPWQHAADAGALDAAARVNKSAAAAQTFAITAESRHPAPRPGARIRIMFGDTELGEYVVTEAVHNLDNVNIYSCVFKALPTDIEVMPIPVNLQVPQSGAQLAVVVENADPAGMGRVRVKFGWQEEDTKTPWLRVLTPDAGSSSIVSKNRGFVFVPEVGDQVLVDFEQNNPDAPFVLGSVFHGKNASGESNMRRTIMTKSGNKIVLDDSAGSILVSDPSGNEWFLDGQGNTLVKAPNRFRVSATDIELSATNNVEISVGNRLLMKVLTSVNIFATSFVQVISGMFKSVSAAVQLSAKDTIAIETENLTASGTERVFLHSDKLMHANSQGNIDLKSKANITKTQSPVTHTPAAVVEIALAVVEFRPKTGYNGEFGFDWLRVDDGSVVHETPYKTTLENGAASAMINTTNPLRPITTINEFPTQADAYTALEKEYNKIPIKRTPPPAIATAPAAPPPVSTVTVAPVATDYFVPWLNLYPKNISKAISTKPNAPYFAELSVIIEIEEDLDKLEFEYDKAVFSIDKPLLSDKTKCSKKISVDKTIKITCESADAKFDGFTTDKEINLWAYPKGSLAKTPAEQITLRQLAGRLIVCKNHKPIRKSAKFVLVRISTQIHTASRKQTGAFSKGDKDMLINVLYQSLVLGTIETAPQVLDLTRDDDYKIKTNPTAGGADIYGKFIFQLPITGTVSAAGTDGGINYGNIPDNLYEDLKTKFLNLEVKGVKVNAKYNSGYFFAFAFDEASASDTPVNRLLGRVKDIGIQNVILFRPGVDNSTLPHEVLHGFGLRHTHREGTAPLDSLKQKFIFQHSKTDNIMSYADYSKTTWHWQWELLNNSIPL